MCRQVLYKGVVHFAQFNIEVENQGRVTCLYALETLKIQGVAIVD